MRSHTKKLSISSVFPLLCFTLLASCIVIVLITGARLYSRANDRDTEDYYHRTVTSYVATRVSQSAVSGDFFVGDFYEGVPKSFGNTLFFLEHFESGTYVTRLYCHEGHLYELFSPVTSELEPSAGEKVLPLESLGFTVEDGILRSDIVFDDGKSTTLRLSLRTEGQKIEK